MIAMISACTHAQVGILGSARRRGSFGCFLHDDNQQQQYSDRPCYQYARSHLGSSRQWGWDPSNGTVSERIGKDADYNRLSAIHFP